MLKSKFYSKSNLCCFTYFIIYFNRYCFKIYILLKKNRSKNLYVFQINFELIFCIVITILHLKKNSIFIQLILKKNCTLVFTIILRQFTIDDIF